MTMLKLYDGDSMKVKDEGELLPGRLIVIEGTDGVGRSTQISLLRPWIESAGFAVVDTGLRRSPLIREGLAAAKEGHTMGSMTLNLFYATDFADRLENLILPSLRSGIIVLTDRYIYSLIARAIVRGADPDWIAGVYGMALIPDAVFYLKVDLNTLVRRIVPRGFDYWESGMDMRLGDDLYESFMRYQALILAQFDAMAQRYHFHIIDASRPIAEVNDDLRLGIAPLLPTG
jgi:dTMP kinase